LVSFSSADIQLSREHQCSFSLEFWLYFFNDFIYIVLRNISNMSQIGPEGLIGLSINEGDILIPLEENLPACLFSHFSKDIVEVAVASLLLTLLMHFLHGQQQTASLNAAHHRHSHQASLLSRVVEVRQHLLGGLG
jgi:hypothetical protein